MKNNTQTRKVNIQKQEKKTRKQRKNTSNHFIQQTLNYLATIKMFHWTTESFAAHKATDALYTKLQTFMDLFVETSLGHYNNKKSLKLSTIEVKKINNNSQLHKYTQIYKKHLKNIRKSLPDSSQSEMINVIDDILTELDVLLYLLTLK